METFQKQDWFLIWGQTAVFRNGCASLSSSKTKKRMYQKGGFASSLQSLGAKVLGLMEVVC